MTTATSPQRRKPRPGSQPETTNAFGEDVHPTAIRAMRAAEEAQSSLAHGRCSVAYWQVLHAKSHLDRLALDMPPIDRYDAITTVGRAIESFRRMCVVDRAAREPRQAAHVARRGSRR